MDHLPSGAVIAIGDNHPAEQAIIIGQLAHEEGWTVPAHFAVVLRTGKKVAVDNSYIWVPCPACKHTFLRFTAQIEHRRLHDGHRVCGDCHDDAWDAQYEAECQDDPRGARP